jgi:hypothetical protein
MVVALGQISPNIAANDIIGQPKVRRQQFTSKEDDILSGRANYFFIFPRTY